MKHLLRIFFCIMSFALYSEESPEAQQVAVQAVVQDLVKKVERAIDEQLITESIRGNVRQVKQLLQAGGSVCCTDGCGRTPLHIALANNRFSVVWQLFQKNPPANTQDIVGRTPLMAVVFLPDNPEEALKVCKELKERGASFDLCDSSGMNALMLAANAHVYREERYKELFKYLADYTKNLDQQSKDGRTALHYAAAMGNTQAIEVLLAKGADSTLRDDKKRTPSDVAHLHKQKVAAVLAR